ncbi:MAG: hypothetical protein IPM51_14745 [Sphingobacteriaceae bacterium]|nr:hypothetical protein [Sphingobacteriaceae bacterium]
MKKENSVGVWMDYHQAKFITVEKEIAIVVSGHDKFPRVDGQGADGTRWGPNSSNNEFTKNQKENAQIKEYFNQLMELLADYQNILLFGPTKAKNELYNLILENKKFSDKKIKVESADQMTDNQLIEFVQENLK